MNRGGIDFDSNLGEFIFPTSVEKLSADVIKISSLEENMTRLQRDLVRGIEKKLKKMICDEKLTLGLH